VLTVVEMLRQKGVVGKFVEFYGAGPGNLTLEDQATIANMAPEYGATCGFFPIDGNLDYLTGTGRPAQVDLVEAYAKTQGMWRDQVDADPVFTYAGAGPGRRRAVAGRAEAPAGPCGLSEGGGKVRPALADHCRRAEEEGAPPRARRPAMAEGPAGPAHPEVQGQRGPTSDRPRRRGDRRDHQLHQHLQPVVMIAAGLWRARRATRASR
jgi:hypothetical protein